MSLETQIEDLRRRQAEAKLPFAEMYGHQISQLESLLAIVKGYWFYELHEDAALFAESRLGKLLLPWLHVGLEQCRKESAGI